jgi:spore germination protein YaaH
MAYDEHYATSARSGPTASLRFVERGILDTLEEVPKEKIIMGLPFFVRLWREVDENGETVTSVRRTVGMNYARRIFTESGAQFTWLPDIGSYYAEYSGVEDGVAFTHRAWFEDVRSTGEKLNIATYYDLAGVAGWRRGLESEDAWQAIADWKTAD